MDKSHTGSRIFLVDVEASGPSPYSGKMTEFGVVDLESGQWFRTQLWDNVPNPQNPAQPLPTKFNPQWTVGYGAHDLQHGFTRNAKDAQTVFQAHSDWLKELAEGKRIVFASDNPGYDFGWVSYGYDEVGLPNPYGWSSRRIGDLYAGVSLQFNNTSRWKGLRETKHSHQSHEDSMGNREALLKIRTAMEELSARSPDHNKALKEILWKSKK